MQLLRPGRPLFMLSGNKEQGPCFSIVVLALLERGCQAVAHRPQQSGHKTAQALSRKPDTTPPRAISAASEHVAEAHFTLASPIQCALNFLSTTRPRLRAACERSMVKWLRQATNETPAISITPPPPGLLVYLRST